MRAHDSLIVSRPGTRKAGALAGLWSAAAVRLGFVDAPAPFRAVEALAETGRSLEAIKQPGAEPLAGPAVLHSDHVAGLLNAHRLLHGSGEGVVLDPGDDLASQRLSTFAVERVAFPEIELPSVVEAPLLVHSGRNAASSIFLRAGQLKC